MANPDETRPRLCLIEDDEIHAERLDRRANLFCLAAPDIQAWVGSTSRSSDDTKDFCGR